MRDMSTPCLGGNALAGKRQQWYMTEMYERAGRHCEKCPTTCMHFALCKESNQQHCELVQGHDQKRMQSDRCLCAQDLLTF